MYGLHSALTSCLRLIKQIESMEREASGLAGAERNSAMSKIRRYRNDVAALRREVLKAVRLALLRTSHPPL